MPRFKEKPEPPETPGHVKKPVEKPVKVCFTLPNGESLCINVRVSKAVMYRIGGPLQHPKGMGTITSITDLPEGTPVDGEIVE